MRCDLHVHSWHSGPADLPLLRRLGRECYSDPLEVYERAVARAMDLVTVRLSGGRQLHVNVFDVEEAA